jgi:hypothetical protein
MLGVRSDSARSQWPDPKRQRVCGNYSNPPYRVFLLILRITPPLDLTAPPDVGVVVLLPFGRLDVMRLVHVERTRIP